MQVDLKTLRAVSEKLFAHLEAQGAPSIDLPHDYYWHVPTASCYDVTHEPRDLTIGQLGEDWAELHKIGSAGSEPHGYALVWLAAVLRAVGETAR